MPRISITDDDRTIAANIRAIRNAQDMSMDALAGKLGLTFQQVQKYERAENRISGGRLVAISRVLKVPISRLFEGCGGRVAA